MHTLMHVMMMCGVVGGVTLLVSLLFAFCVNKILQSKSLHWFLSIVFKQIILPSQLVIWLFGGMTCYTFIAKFYDIADVLPILLLQQIIVALAAFWALFRIKFAVETKVSNHDFAAQHHIDKTLMSMVFKLMTAGLIVAFVITMLTILGMPIQSLLVFGGAVSIAVGLASKTVMENFFGGLMIYANRPFKVGDMISSPEKNIEGVVEEIGWYSTRIRTLDRRPLYVPNAMFINIIVQNSSRMYNRRIKMVIGLRYDDLHVVEMIVSDIQAMLNEHEGIDHKQRCSVHWIAFGQHSLDIEVYAFTVATKVKDFRDVQQQILLQISKIIEKHNAQVAFPTQVVQISK